MVELCSKDGMIKPGFKLGSSLFPSQISEPFRFDP
jgi:hypothetical protein